MLEELKIWIAHGVRVDVRVEDVSSTQFSNVLIKQYDDNGIVIEGEGRGGRPRLVPFFSIAWIQAVG